MNRMCWPSLIVTSAMMSAIGCCFLFVIIFFLPSSAIGAEITLKSSIKIKSEYSDNIQFSRINKKSDFYADIKPAVEFNYDTAVLNLSSKAAVDFLRYKKETQLNDENQQYDLNGEYKISERLRLNGSLSFLKDTTLESELQETGIVTVRSDRKRKNAGGGLSYQLTQLSDIGVNYTYSKTEYDWPGNVDYDYDTISISYNRRLKNGTDSFMIRPSYARYDSRASKVDNYTLSLGWAHSFNETLSLTVFAGMRHTKVEYSLIQSALIFDPTIFPPFRVIFQEVKETERKWGGVADVSFRKTGETYSTSLGYNYDISYSSLGEPIDKNRMYCLANKKISDKFQAQFSGSVYFSKSTGKLSNEDRRYYALTPSLDYKITKDHTLKIAYSYSQSYDKTLSSDKTADQNRIWIILNFNFPKKWSL